MKPASTTSSTAALFEPVRRAPRRAWPGRARPRARTPPSRCPPPPHARSPRASARLDATPTISTALRAAEVVDQRLQVRPLTRDTSTAIRKLTRRDARKHRIGTVGRLERAPPRSAGPRAPGCPRAACAPTRRTPAARRTSCAGSSCCASRAGSPRRSCARPPAARRRPPRGSPRRGSWIATGSGGGASTTSDGVHTSQHSRTAAGGDVSPK